MIINPVMIRNMLNARGAHATIVSVMTVFLPLPANQLISRRDVAEKHLRTTKLRAMGKPHRNNFTAKVFRGGDQMFAERTGARALTQRPGDNPRPSVIFRQRRSSATRPW
jgi:hypothetical protein